jgi:hypothetical protein
MVSIVRIYAATTATRKMTMMAVTKIVTLPCRYARKEKASQFPQMNLFLIILAL